MNVNEENFSLYFDNFFIWAKLITFLTRLGFAATGTVRNNRTEKSRLLKIASYKERERRDFDSVLDEKNNIVAVRWKDNSAVTLLSNQHGTKLIQQATRSSAAESVK